MDLRHSKRYGSRHHHLDYKRPRTTATQESQPGEISFRGSTLLPTLGRLTAHAVCDWSACAPRSIMAARNCARARLLKGLTLAAEQVFPSETTILTATSAWTRPMLG